MVNTVNGRRRRPTKGRVCISTSVALTAPRSRAVGYPCICAKASPAATSAMAASVIAGCSRGIRERMAIHLSTPQTVTAHFVMRISLTGDQQSTRNHSAGGCLLAARPMPRTSDGCDPACHAGTEGIAELG
jgi:hypothetical protein